MYGWDPAKHESLLTSSMVDDARTRSSFNASEEVVVSSNGRPSFAKRQKEIARAEKQRDKAAERARRAVEKKNRPDAPPGVDPDIAGVVPGPQPPSEE